MSREPLVSVLMSVYNDDEFLPAAVQSILGQSFTDFEFVIVNDGSTDSSRAYLDQISDSRVRCFHNDRNIGLTRSLNFGLQQCRGRFVARMDSDDVAMPDRLAKQVRFLEAHTDVGILGTARELIDEKETVVAIATQPAEDYAIRWKCLLGNPFAHPTVMLCREILVAHDLRYDESFRTAQDYELWTRLLMHTRGANLQEPLLRYRLRDAGISRSKHAEQIVNHDRIAQAAMDRLLPTFRLAAGEVSELRGRFGGFSVRDSTKDPQDPRWLQRYEQLADAFERTYGRRAA